ncbi:AAA family ATPase [Devosia sp. J2-20]|jgi:pilus assembly protein CpaE|uniref:AAA family ATPase n=1 Tax=Devosia litorisediminis TaxID=2829817 RepID=A0A942ECJ6_9HYPH|nr:MULTISPECIES: AAA family ATPase [Devosia]MBS3849929.1 AAA family ATPase [Devosia litorisediminis]MCZ4346929.1 AAA family ATPase [Devosia neptuniae]WDR00652.1 AAA family ATPase [Devosia sp. J2-20]|tara:strand:+ start:6396 stop:7667 length:1272 start_codon:yes stop_codon:yes gene_type:complete
MSFLTPDSKKADEPAAEIATGARLIPRITIQAFCEHSQTAQLVESAIHDRRMSKVALTTHNGGIDGAVETYKSNPTPNLIVVESTLAPDMMLGALEKLAEVCDASTRVVVLGHVNDVLLYRDLVRSGISEYIVLPATASQIVSAITELFASENAAPIGRTVGFVSAKGGAGGSTVAHNVTWAIATALRQDSLILDMDLAFGTAGLNFNQDPPHGLADAVTANQKVDQTMLDRLMSKAASHINLLTAPVTLDHTFDFEEREFEQIIEMCQNTMPVVVLDIPHAWNAWVRHTLATIDEVVIVAEPDLANLRNAKNLADTIKALRPTENPPSLVLNKVGLPRRPEISPGEFASSIECELIGQLQFDAALFGTAANNGQMIAEVAANNKINEIYRAIGMQVTGRQAAHVGGKSGSLMKLPSFLKKRA